MSKKILLIMIGIIVLAGCIFAYYFYFKNENITDAVKFSEEYSTVSKNNVFVYRTEEEIIKILEGGTGVVYLGFPECPWCQQYVQYLNEVALKTGLDKIYYLNILNIRKDNTENYKKIVSLLDGYLLNDDEGNPRVYVPDITFIKDGTIIGHDNETSVVTEEDGTPQEYWTEEKVSTLKTKLTSLVKSVLEKSCTTCNK